MLSVVDGVEQLQTFSARPCRSSSYRPPRPSPSRVHRLVDLPVATVVVAAALFGLILPGQRSAQREASVARQRAFSPSAREFLDVRLPTLKAFGQGARPPALAEGARPSDETMWVLGASVATRGITDIRLPPRRRAICSRSAPGAYRMMSLEALLIVLMAGTEIFRPLRDLRTVLHQGMNGQSAAQGLHALLGAVESAPAGGAAVSAETWRRPSIAFEGVRFAYPGVRGAALEDLTFAVGAAERVGIVGPSGAGKSSIVRLLMRLHDPQQAARASGTRTWRLRPRTCGGTSPSSRKYLPLHGTVEENLRLGRPDATRPRWKRRRGRQAHEFIQALPDGCKRHRGARRALRAASASASRSHAPC
jgi:ATP-binding cassette subfamily C protein CydCD